ncbi:hypothetical protein F7725_002575 [Dissostichus mawsoni]|uniref:Mediator of RNA polymerase II transcription subunit 4 n=1 Tax=Dissostichus mawsoni TaxID=36200 RepID=A0A7J5Y2R5_DISMA|nr:hypothetical protein F7725_002575 [Dissostichus mawsoni]
MAAVEKSTKDRLLSVLEDLEVLSRELIEMLALSRSQKLPQPGEDIRVLELLVQRDQELQDLMEVAQQQGKVQEEMQLLEKEVTPAGRTPQTWRCAAACWVMANLPTNGVNGHLPGDALAAGRLPECVQQAKDSLRSLADSPEQG